MQNPNVTERKGDEESSGAARRNVSRIILKTPMIQACCSLCLVSTGNRRRSENGLSLTVLGSRPYRMALLEARDLQKGSRDEAEVRLLRALESCPYAVLSIQSCSACRKPAHHPSLSSLEIQHLLLELPRSFRQLVELASADQFGIHKF